MLTKPPDIQALMDRLARAYPDARCALDHGDPFQLVVATILSAQCTDARVNLTTPALFARFPDAAALAEAPLLEVEDLIRSTGFFRNKAKNLVAMAQALLVRHGGLLPRTLEDLAALPGVGQKTANVVLANAFDVPALAVDTHIFRVARRLGLSKAATPEKVEADLCRRFPRDHWIPLHHQLIFHGRRICEARKPQCGQCPLLDLCPTGLGKIKDPHTGRRFEAIEPTPTNPPEARSPKSEAPSLRLLSLVPSVTECLVQWGLAASVVGRTRYCIAPKWIRATIPAVGGTKDPDLQKIQDLKPDLVILEKDENPKAVAEALDRLGIPWLCLDIARVRDCARAWRTLGRAVGAGDQAEARAQALEEALPKRPRKGPRTLTLIWRNPWMAAGEDTYVADLARQAGFTPIGGLDINEGGPPASSGRSASPLGLPRLMDGPSPPIRPRYPAFEEAELDALDPDVILLPTEPFRFNARHQAELQARFPKARVRLVDGQAMTWYLSRTEQGLQLLRELKSSLEP